MTYCQTCGKCIRVEHISHEGIQQSSVEHVSHEGIQQSSVEHVSHEGIQQSSVEHVSHEGIQQSSVEHVSHEGIQQSSVEHISHEGPLAESWVSAVDRQCSVVVEVLKETGLIGSLPNGAAGNRMDDAQDNTMATKKFLGAE